MQIFYFNLHSKSTIRFGPFWTFEIETLKTIHVKIPKTIGKTSKKILKLKTCAIFAIVYFQSEKVIDLRLFSFECTVVTRHPSVLFSILNAYRSVPDFRFKPLINSLIQYPTLEIGVRNPNQFLCSISRAGYWIRELIGIWIETPVLT